MNGLRGARVVLLDDEPAEAVPVIKALSRMGIPAVFFDGKNSLPSKKNRLRGVRLAILDMNLGVTGSNESIASTLVQTFSQIIDADNGPYGILIWTNHPDLRELVAKYIHVHPTMPKPVFIVTLKKAAFRVRRRGGDLQFAMRKLTRELRSVLAENSPLECLEVWEERCFRAATNVTNSLASNDTSKGENLDEWRKAWRDETLKLLLVLSKAHAEQHHTRENCLPSIFLALNPLHADRMDLLADQLAEDLSHHIDQIMGATGGSAVERKGRVNSMLHLAADQLQKFNPGNLYVFSRRNRPEFMPALDEALQDCLQGNAASQQTAQQQSRLCGIEVTPACDHAQNKMRVSRLVTGVLVPWETKGAIKTNAGFLKVAGPFYIPKKGSSFNDGAYLLVLNSRYVVTAKPSAVKALPAIARVRTHLLSDIQAWASYQTARQGVMMLS